VVLTNLTFIYINAFDKLEMIHSLWHTWYVRARMNSDKAGETRMSDFVCA